ncbi:MAG: hypothetical protein ACMXYL_03905 [Candidatus Woesearchaeota archaeon]
MTIIMNGLDIMFFYHYIHVLGLVIGMGSAIVIETIGFIARKSGFWTRVAVDTHYVTKPLIWFGTILLSLSWILIMESDAIVHPYYWKTLLLLLLIINGSYLSFFVSPRIINHRKHSDGEPLPSKLQTIILPSAIVSVLGWLLMVFLTLLYWNA